MGHITEEQSDLFGNTLIDHLTMSQTWRSRSFICVWPVQSKASSFPLLANMSQTYYPSVLNIQSFPSNIMTFNLYIGKRGGAPFSFLLQIFVIFSKLVRQNLQFILQPHTKACAAQAFCICCSFLLRFYLIKQVFLWIAIRLCGCRDKPNV